jgi:hypothetical protein
MPETKRDRGESLQKERAGNQQPAGTGTHEMHRAEQKHADRDPKALGIAGRKKREAPSE